MTSTVLDKSCMPRTNRLLGPLSAPHHSAAPASRIQSRKCRVRASEQGSAAWQPITASPHDVARSILQAAMQGTITLEEAACAVTAFTQGQKDTSAASTRAAHQRFPEVVWGTGKTAEQTANQIIALSKKQRVTLALKIEPEMYAAVRKYAPGVKYNMASRSLSYSSEESLALPKQPRMHGSVALLATSTADMVVAEEFKAVAEAMGCYVFRVGSAGNLHGVLENLEGIQSANAVVVVTSMDATLPSMVSELVDAPVIAVPTTASQATSPHSMSTMLSAFSSTAPGVSVVGSDNGFAAAMLTARVLRSAQKLHKMRSAAEAAQRAADEAAAALDSAPAYPNSGNLAPSNRYANGYTNGHAFSVNSYANGVASRHEELQGGFIHPEMHAHAGASSAHHSIIVDGEVVSPSKDVQLAEAMGELQKALGSYPGNGNGHGHGGYANGHAAANGNMNGLHLNGYANGHRHSNGHSNGQVHTS